MAKIKQKICRLCLKDIKKGSFKTIDNIKIEMLEVLLISMDLKICEETEICNQCAATLDECFDFKSKCLLVEDCIVPFMVDNEKVDLKMVVEKEMKIGKQVQLENHKICRLCMQVVQDIDFIYFDNLSESASIRDMLQTCLSGLDINSTIDALICKICMESLKDYHDFKESCLDVEKKIKEYQSEEFESNGTEKVKLSDLLKKKNVKEKVKRNVKNGRAESDSRSQSADDNSTDLEMDVDKPVKKKVYKGPSWPMGAEDNSLSHRNPDEVPKYKCPHCPLESKYKSNIIKHLKNLNKRNTNKKFKCHFCSFRCTTKEELEEHKEKHSDLSYNADDNSTDLEMDVDKPVKKKVYKGPSWPMGAEDNSLSHRNPDEVPKYKCPHCPLESKYKSNIVKHLKNLNKRNTNKKFKCHFCSFRCTTKEELEEHKEKHSDLFYNADDNSTDLEMDVDKPAKKKVNKGPSWPMGAEDNSLSHRNPDEVPKYKCHHCPLESKYKSNIVKHLRNLNKRNTNKKFKCHFCPIRCTTKEELEEHKEIHSDLFYKCSKCIFISRYKNNIRRHMATHQEPGQRKLKKCKLCNFEAKTQKTINTHMNTHKDSCETKTFVCEICNFETKREDFLDRHKKRVHSKTDELILFKCLHCVFQTVSKGSLKCHLLRHKNADEVEMFSCEQCSFKSKYKTSIYTHTKMCHGKDLKTYKCSLCTYETIEKHNFQKHQIVHLNPGETPMYQCATCSFATKHKYNLKYHAEVCKKKNNIDKRKQS